MSIRATPYFNANNRRSSYYVDKCRQMHSKCAFPDQSIPRIWFDVWIIIVSVCLFVFAFAFAFVFKLSFYTDFFSKITLAFLVLPF